MTETPSSRAYIFVFMGLAVLTFLTVSVAFVDLGRMNLFSALLIAALKASLIVYFFMHLGRMQMMVKVFAVGSLLWVSILLFYTFSDYISRSWVNNPSFWK